MGNYGNNWQNWTLPNWTTEPGLDLPKILPFILSIDPRYDSSFPNQENVWKNRMRARGGTQIPPSAPSEPSEIFVTTSGGGKSLQQCYQRGPSPKRLQRNWPEKVSSLSTCMLSHFSHVQLCATLWAVATRLLCPWDSQGKPTGVDCLAFFQGIFPTQGSNPWLLHLEYWQVGSLLLAPPGKPLFKHSTVETQ